MRANGKRVHDSEDGRSEVAVSREARTDAKSVTVDYIARRKSEMPDAAY